MTRVILIRHGQSNFNTRRIVQGRCDRSELTDLGRQQAACVAEALQGLPLDALYSSPLRRARQTAEAIAAGLDAPPPLETSDLLKEVDLPLWEEMPVAEIRAKFPDAYRCWKTRPHEFFMDLPDGRRHFPVLSLRDQAEQFLRALLADRAGQTVAVVGHNGINRSLISAAAGIGPDRYHCLLQSNCGISVLNFKGNLGDPMQLESIDQTGHLAGLDGVEALPPWREGDRGPRLLLVRHGETEWNREGRFQGQIDVPLNDNGRAQAARAAEFLAPVPLDLAFSSPMLRPKETAEIILERHPGLSLHLLDGLREIGHGLWEGKYEADIEGDYPGLLHQWQTAPETVQMPEGENLQQVWDRAVAAWQEIVAKAARAQEEAQRPLTAMVVAHDAVNKALLCHLTGLGPDCIWRFKQGNGGVTVVHYPQGPEGLPMLQRLNVTHHLSGSVLDKTAAGAL